ncbi:MAG: CPBP family intramembrane metalloprotease [Solirubrobacteraceae bacterium]|nr:CPBP family intramembrane metalloprotease [Solirubrobacteraceae bacterium]
MTQVGVSAPPAVRGPHTAAAIATLELALCAAAVLFDLLLPTLLILAIATVSLRVRRRRFADLGFHRPASPGRLVAITIALTVAWTALQLGLFLPILEHLTGEHQDVSGFTDVEGNAGLLAALLIASWTLAALGEETAFRGFLPARAGDVIGRSAPAIALAAVLSAALFGAAHTEQGTIGVAATFLDGLFFSALSLRLGTLWAPVLAHGLNNTIGLTAYFLVGPITGLW